MKEVIAAPAPKNRDGSWTAPEGSPFRSLTAEEVVDLEFTANGTTPNFEPVSMFKPEGYPGLMEQHNATWEETHPVAQAIYERRGFKPKDAK